MADCFMTFDGARSGIWCAPATFPEKIAMAIEVAFTRRVMFSIDTTFMHHDKDLAAARQ